MGEVSNIRGTKYENPKICINYDETYSMCDFTKKDTDCNGDDSKCEQ